MYCTSSVVPQQLVLYDKPTCLTLLNEFFPHLFNNFLFQERAEIILTTIFAFYYFFFSKVFHFLSLLNLAAFFAEMY